MDIKMVDITGLLKDVEFVLVLPTLSFFALAVNAKISQKAGFTPQKQRIALTFSLLLFVFCTATIVQDRSVLLALWKCDPVYYSAVYAMCGSFTVGVIAFLIYWKLRPELWRKK